MAIRQVHKVQVEHEQESHQTDDAGVEERGDHGTPLHEVHAVLGQPVEALEAEQEREHGDEARAEVVAEDGEGETRLRDHVPVT